MYKSHLKVAWRGLTRHKIFALINIGGLSIGIAACLLISLYVHYELGFDSYHIKKDRIVRVTNFVKTPEAADNMNIALTPTLLATTLNKNYPEVELAVRYAPDAAVVKVNDQLFKEDLFYKSEPNIFKVFNYEFAEGDAAHALADPRSIVISHKLAVKYFGSQSAIGKTITCNGQLCHITAVLKEQPENTDFKVNALVPEDFSKATTWLGDDFAVYTYVLFKQKPDLAAFDAKLDRISKSDIQAEFNKMGALHYALKFTSTPFTALHFDNTKLGDTPKGDKQLVYIFSVLAAIILLIALLNYINLSTARATERAKEIGIRKVNGAVRYSLIGQFLFESFFVTVIALLIAIALMFATLPFLNNLLQIRITLAGSGLSFLLICLLVLASSLISGIYPAFVLSSFKPVTALKGDVKHGRGGLTLRKAITITQFVMATVMIAGAFIMNRQINFVQHRSPGYSQRHVLNISLPDDSLKQLRVPAFNNSLQLLPQVKGTSVESGLALVNNAMPKATTIVTVNGSRRELTTNYFSIDDKFIPLLNMRIMAGRNFAANMLTDKNEGFIVNEAFIKQVGWKDPIGQAIEGFNHKGRVVGVVKDFHYASMHNPIAPLAIIYQSYKPASLLVKVNAKDLDLVKHKWQTFFPDVPFTYEFLDDAFNVLYQKDVTTIRLFNSFTLLSILIACLGLYGLAQLMISKRTKEVGIRKVLGAALNQLLILLAKDFVKLIAIAALLALPLTWLLMNKWLASYAYHISISWWVLLVPVLAILIISVLVISYQTIRVAISNPVKSLKSE